MLRLLDTSGLDFLDNGMYHYHKAFSSMEWEKYSIFHTWQVPKTGGSLVPLPVCIMFRKADDLILFAEASKSQIDVIMECLNNFCAISGQVISPAKEKLFVSPNFHSYTRGSLKRLTTTYSKKFKIGWLDGRQSSCLWLEEHCWFSL